MHFVQRLALLIPTGLTFLVQAAEPAGNQIRCDPAFYGPLLRVDQPSDINELNGGLVETDFRYMRNRNDHESGPLLSGKELADRHRLICKKAEKCFFESGALFHQANNPTLNDPLAFLLPPNWVTAAAMARPPVPLYVPREVNADGQWSAISKEQMFGSFPASNYLYRLAASPLAADPSKVRNVRASLQYLANYTRRLAEAYQRGGENSVLQTGAEIISQTDDAYLGREMRKNKAIVLAVTNPGPAELAEGKGLGLPNRQVPPDLLRRIQNAVIGERLRHGDVALERWNIADPNQRKHMMGVLRDLVPTGSQDSKLWIWVNGPLQPNAVFVGENATRYMNDLISEINQYNRTTTGPKIDMSRVRFLSKPLVELPKDPSAQIAFADSTINSYRNLCLATVDFKVNPATARRIFGTLPSAQKTLTAR